MSDMTIGSERKHIIMFMIPVLLGNLFQNFYNIIDAMIVGQFLGVDALAAIGLTGSYVYFVVGWIMGLTSGFGVLLSQAYGAKDEYQMKHYVAISVYLSIIAAVVMTVGLLILNGWILNLMNTPENIFGQTYRYLMIIFIGIPFTILYNLLASIARAMGDGRTPLYFLILSSALNIVLDIIFVAILPFGVAGAASATIISQAVSGVLCLIYVYRKYPEVHFTKQEGQWSWETAGKMFGLGLPMALQFSITAIGLMIVQSSLNTLGEIYIASHAASTKIQAVLIQFYVALGASIATFIGQNYGAREFDRVKRGVKESLYIAVVMCAVIMPVAYFICPNLVLLFVDDPTGEMVAISKQMFHICLWFYPFLVLIYIYRNVIQGLGNGVVAMIGGILELIMRVGVIMLLFESLQYVGIVLTDPIAWIISVVFLAPYYYWFAHKKFKEMDLEAVVESEG